MSDFYITLPSNASMELFPTNTLSNFYVQLPQSLELKDQWEVGLSEILFPRSFLNVTKTKEYRIRIITRFTEPIDALDLYLEEGYYDTNEILIEALNKLSPNPDMIAVQYNAHNKRVVFNLHPSIRLDIGKNLAEMLGFRGRTKISVEILEAPKQANVHFHFNAMYLYSDIVAPCPVGDSLAPLLRVLPMPGKFGEMTSSIFIKPHYYPVSRKSIDVIHTYITDDAGENVAFNSGRCIVVLHFRRLK